MKEGFLGFLKKEKVAQGSSVEAALAELNAGLGRRALEAYETTDPEKRKKLMAEAVAYTARRSYEEVHRAGSDPKQLAELEAFFEKAASDAVTLYEPFAGATQSNPQGHAEEYNRTTSEGLADLNRAHLNPLGGLLEKPLSGEEIQNIVNRSNFTDVVSFAAQQLGVKMPQDMSPESVQNLLRTAKVSETGKAKVDDKLPVEASGALNGTEMTALELAVRLPNVTWMASQMNRADWEEKTDRINFKIRNAFSPYDYLKRVMFEKVRAEHGDEAALLAVAFEIWKDVMEIKEVAQEA